MNNNNLNWRDRRSLKNVSKDAKIQLTDGTFLDAIAIAKIVDMAPEDLDTMKEIADWISNHEEEVVSILEGLDSKADKGDVEALAEVVDTKATKDEVNSKYSKPTGGIPKSDLTTSVQASLNKADTALQSHQDISNLATKTEVNAKYTKPSAGIPKTDLNSAVQASLNKADSALQNHQDISHLATKEEVENNEKVTAAALVDLETRKVNIEDIPSIPTKVSELINDSGFITTHQDISGKQDAITDLDTIRSGAAKGATSLQTSQRGVANGVASLDSTGKVPSSQLPSYVDDVLEYSTLSNLPSPGETGKIYVTTNDNKSYRWTGTTYIEISKSIIIGETTGTAFDGGKGKELLDDLSVIKQTIEDNEKITSAALVELNKRISNIEQQLNS